jgi:hypothetical protein
MKVFMDFTGDTEEGCDVESYYDSVEFSTPNDGSCEGWAESVKMFVKPANYSSEQVLASALFAEGGAYLHPRDFVQIASLLSDRCAERLANALAERKPDPKSEGASDAN